MYLVNFFHLDSRIIYEMHLNVDLIFEDVIFIFLNATESLNHCDFSRFFVLINLDILYLFFGLKTSLRQNIHREFYFYEYK